MASTLPAPLDETTIPSAFSVTAIGSAGGCRLRIVLASSIRGPTKLPAGPKAELGLLGHTVLERVGRGDGDGEAVFETCRGETTARLAADPATSSYADLAFVLGAAAWSRFRADVIVRSRRLGGPRRSSQGAATRRDATLSTGREKSISSSALRLKGRLDGLTRLQDSRWEIRDYKLGEIRDASGRIRPEIIFQLRSYGLLALEREPSAEIQLVVDNRHDHEIPFGPAERVKARREIKRAWRGLTAGSVVHAYEIVSPGACCADCPFRHRCPAYLSSAPSWWKLSPDTPTELARDVSGTVLKFENDPFGGASVTVQDAGGRIVRVDRLDSRHGVDKGIEGRGIWMFNLESTVFRHAADGRSIHPTTFHELPADSTQRRAWALNIFRVPALPLRPRAAQACDEANRP